MLRCFLSAVEKIFSREPLYSSDISTLEKLTQFPQNNKSGDRDNRFPWGTDNPGEPWPAERTRQTARKPRKVVKSWREKDKLGSAWLGEGSSVPHTQSACADIRHLVHHLSSGPGGHTWALKPRPPGRHEPQQLPGPTSLESAYIAAGTSLSRNPQHLES